MNWLSQNEGWKLGLSYRNNLKALHLYCEPTFSILVLLGVSNTSFAKTIETRIGKLKFDHDLPTAKLDSPTSVYSPKPAFLDRAWILPDTGKAKWKGF